MYLVEKHIIKETHPYYKECDELCFKAKNVYNQSLYNVRQHYFETKKYLNMFENYNVVKNQECYSYLPTKVVCNILRRVDETFKSFFALLKNKDVKNRIPKYLDKEKGRYAVPYPKQALGKRNFSKTHTIRLSQTNIYVHTRVENFDDIHEVRIVPRLDHFVIELVYTKECKATMKDNGIVSSIDLGIGNLATVTFNNGESPIIMNGRPVKSINQYYNKKLAHYQSKLKGKSKTSRRIRRLSNKRNRKLNDYMHKASRMLVNHLVSKGVSTLVIGKNTSMKQDINCGKANNQSIVQAPIFRFADILKYKCELEGIRVIFIEESYTSKCSFFDNEGICRHDKYLGKRAKRGLFVTAKGMLVNADVNGSYNIMKKAVPNAFADGIEALGVVPTVLTVKG